MEKMSASEKPAKRVILGGYFAGRSITALMTHISYGVLHGGRRARVEASELRSRVR